MLLTDYKDFNKMKKQISISLSQMIKLLALILKCITHSLIVSQVSNLKISSKPSWE